MAKNFKDEIKKITEQIEEIRSEYADLQEEIGAAEKRKVAAKEQYNQCLDRGDEKGMSNALRTIRESNSQIESIKEQLGDFSGRVSALREKQAALVTNVRAERPGLDEAIEKAKKDLQIHKNCIDKVASILTEINKLSQTVSGGSQ